MQEGNGVNSTLETKMCSDFKDALQIHPVQKNSTLVLVGVHEIFYFLATNVVVSFFSLKVTE